MLYDIKLMDDKGNEQIQEIREEDDEGDGAAGGATDVAFYPNNKDPKNPLELNVQFSAESKEMQFEKDD